MPQLKLNSEHFYQLNQNHVLTWMALLYFSDQETIHRDWDMFAFNLNELSQNIQVRTQWIKNYSFNK